MSKSTDLEKILREFAMSFPGAYEEFPWGERAVKVKGKVFVFMRADEKTLSMSAKLPHSRDMAADLPFAEPTHYGLGKHGWVSATVKGSEKGIAKLLQEWIAESYRAVAPKKMVAELGGK